MSKSKPLKQVNEAWGVMYTMDGTTIELDGNRVYCTPKVWKRRIFPVSDLPRVLEGKKVIGIGEDSIGDEAHNLINGVVLDSVAKVNEFFSL